jgi:ABC-2 type transport system permease protein
MQAYAKMLWSLTLVSLKMYFRNRAAIFFSLFFPLILIAVFGLLGQSDGKGSIKIALTDNAHTQLSQSYVDAVKKIDTFEVNQVDESQAREQLVKGKIDLEVVIPKEFGAGQAKPGAPVNIHTYYNQAKPGSGQTASLIFGQLATGFNQQITKSPTVIGLESTGVKTSNLSYIDFILPGLLAMMIMQTGIFSVAFGFISFKTSGALRRIQATPIRAANFLIAQSITRYITVVVQLALLTFVGMRFFDLHLNGSLASLAIVVTLGTGVFLAMGFAVAGGAKDENQAAPLAQLLQLPQLFLSGIFFPRDGFPDWLKHITDFFPLTYLSDAIRQIFNDNVSLWSLHTDIIGLLVWLVIAYLIADRVFKWE